MHADFQEREGEEKQDYLFQIDLKLKNKIKNYYIPIMDDDDDDGENDN